MCSEFLKFSLTYSGKVMSPDHQASLTGSQMSVKRLKQCGFPRTAGSGNKNKFTLFYIETRIFYDLFCTIVVCKCKM